jgi:hypothetical protein
MALEYDHYLSTHMKPAHALEKLASRIPELTWSEDRSFLADTPVQISATEPRAPTQRMLEDAFHFTPTLRVGFRRRLDADWDRLRQLLLDVTLLLLDDAQDAVLLFNGETIVLQRLGGHLVYNSEYELGDDDWLKRRLTLPFETRPLPSPLL